MTAVDQRAVEPAGPVLDFRLPRFIRLAWTSRAARTVWEPRVEAAAAAAASYWINAAERGTVDLALVRLAPFETPLARRRFKAAGRRLAILGPTAPSGVADLLATPRAMGLWCLGGAARTVEAGEAAWSGGDVAGLGEMLGLPRCCVQALVADDPLQRPEWAALQGGGLTSWRTNYALHRLGLSPAPWLPCRADCAGTLNWLAGQEPPLGVGEILSWPLEWSALHGIAQVLTPVFRLVHDTVATGRKTQHVRGTLEAAPAESAVGLVFPYRPPRRRPLEVRRTFRRGVENIAQAAPPVEVGRVRSLASDARARTLSEPLLLEGAAAGWPALSRWSTATIASLVAEASASPERSLEVGFAPMPPHMIADVGFRQLGLAEAGLMIGLESDGTGGLLRAPKLNDAWCALIRGRRRWVFCAPGSEADLVDCEPDLLDRGLRDRLSRRGLDIRECDQGPGDVIGLPAGWWWQVRNLEPTLFVVA